MRVASVPLLIFAFVPTGSCLFWGTPPNVLNYQFGIPRWKFLPFPNNPPNPGWLSAWEEVDQVVGEAPPQRLMINWANNVEIV